MPFVDVSEADWRKCGSCAGGADRSRCEGERYLRELPTINTEGFWDYCKDLESEMLRSDFSRDVTKNVSKADIIAVARANPRIVKQYAKSLEETLPTLYDLDRDQKGLVSWVQPTQTFLFQRLRTDMDKQDVPTSLLLQSPQIYDAGS